MTTRITKSREGWEAKTQLDMGFDRKVLVINTYKSYNGLVTTAQVWTVSEDGIGMSCALFGGNFSERTKHEGIRCTEKAVRELHAKALATADDTMARAIAHHQPKPAFTDAQLANMFANVPSLDGFEGVAA